MTEQCMVTPYLIRGPRPCQHNKVQSRLETSLVINHQVSPYQDLAEVLVHDPDPLQKR